MGTVQEISSQDIYTVQALLCSSLKLQNHIL